MVKTNPVNIVQKQSLYNEIHSLKNTSIENVRTLYGDLGIDVFEGRTPTILSKSERIISKNLLYRIVTWFTGGGYLDYEKEDRLYDIVFKYVSNKQSGLVKNIEKKFGQRGMQELEKLCRMNYVNI